MVAQTHVSPITLALIFPLVLFLRYLVRYLTNPLRKIPAAHFLAPFTSLWIYYVRWRSIENSTLKAAHEKLGPIVCLGPKEISVNCVKGGIRDVYAGGFPKGDVEGGYNWYNFFSNYGGKSVVTASPALLASASRILYERFLPNLASTFSSEEAGVLNIQALVNATTMDVVTAYIFGLKSSSNLTDHPKQLEWFLDLYNSRRSFNFWPQEFPRLTDFLVKWFGYRLVPKWVDEANGEIEKWTKDMCESAEVVIREGIVKPEDTPTVYQQLSAMLSKDAMKAGDAKADLTLPIASEVLDHLAAGFDTSGITLTYVIHELCVHPKVQARLQEELEALSPPIVPSHSPNLPDPKSVDNLPFLHAVIWETLRLHSAIPGPQPRFTPPQGCRLGPETESYYVPGGVRVSASAGLLHLNEDVYEDAATWKPERWLDLGKAGEEKKKDMESRWFWAFGSGGRMCVGSHLAVYQMKYIVAALYSNYTTTTVDDAGIEQLDAYTAPPKSDKLMIKLHKQPAWQ